MSKSITSIDSFSIYRAQTGFVFMYSRLGW